VMQLSGSGSLFILDLIVGHESSSYGLFIC
jgi:hypothetical protein